MKNKLQISKHLVIAIIESGYKNHGMSITQEFLNLYQYLSDSIENEEALCLLDEMDEIAEKNLIPKFMAYILVTLETVKS